MSRPTQPGMDYKIIRDNRSTYNVTAPGREANPGAYRGGNAGASGNDRPFQPPQGRDSQPVKDYKIIRDNRSTFNVTAPGHESNPGRYYPGGSNASGNDRPFQPGQKGRNPRARAQPGPATDVTPQRAPDYKIAKSNASSYNIIAHK